MCRIQGVPRPRMKAAIEEEKAYAMSDLGSSSSTTRCSSREPKTPRVSGLPVRSSGSDWIFLFRRLIGIVIVLIPFSSRRKRAAFSSSSSWEKQTMVTLCSREKRSTSRQVMILSPRLGG